MSTASGMLWPYFFFILLTSVGRLMWKLSILASCLPRPKIADTRVHRCPRKSVKLGSVGSEIDSFLLSAKNLFVFSSAWHGVVIPTRKMSKSTLENCFGCLFYGKLISNLRKVWKEPRIGKHQFGEASNISCSVSNAFEGLRNCQEHMPHPSPSWRRDTLARAPGPARPSRPPPRSIREPQGPLGRPAPLPGAPPRRRCRWTWAPAGRTFEVEGAAVLYTDNLWYYDYYITELGTCGFSVFFIKSKMRPFDHFFLSDFDWG